MKRLVRKLWLILPVLFIGGSVVAAWLILHSASTNKADQIVTCTGQKQDQFSCWQQRYDTMTQQQSPEAAFIDFKKAYQSIPFVKDNCHVIAHVIGRAAAVRYPTLAETYKHGDDFCWSGYYHGAIETIAARIGPEKILSQINNVCSEFARKQPHGFDHYNCVHGMGHGLMSIQDDHLFSALTSCDKYEGQWQQETCYSGVFMENYKIDVSPDDGGSKYLKSDNPVYPCNAVAQKYQRQCYLMQSSHILKTVGGDFAQSFEICSGVTAPSNTTCYQGLGRDVSWNTDSGKEDTIRLCMSGPTAEARQNCFVGAARDYVLHYRSDQQSLAMCNSVPDAQLAASCAVAAKDNYPELST